MKHHYARGVQGLPLRCHFLFCTTLPAIISRSIFQKVFWLSVVSSVWNFSQRKAIRLSWRIYSFTDKDQRLLA